MDRNHQKVGPEQGGAFEFCALYTMPEFHDPGSSGQPAPVGGEAVSLTSALHGCKKSAAALHASKDNRSLLCLLGDTPENRDSWLAPLVFRIQLTQGKVSSSKII